MNLKRRQKFKLSLRPANGGNGGNGGFCGFCGFG